MDFTFLAEIIFVKLGMYETNNVPYKECNPDLELFYEISPEA